MCPTEVVWQELARPFLLLLGLPSQPGPRQPEPGPSFEETPAKLAPYGDPSVSVPPGVVVIQTPESHPKRLYCVVAPCFKMWVFWFSGRYSTENRPVLHFPVVE